MALRWRTLLPCALVLYVLLMLLAGGAAQAATYEFNGGGIGGCSLSNRVYTCPNVGGLGEYDRIVIGTGYTVNVQADISFGYNQGLTMSGTARLTSTGDLSIANLQSSNLSITGGSFSAGKTFSAGDQRQTITANVTAASMRLGSGSGLTITGTLVSTGPVTVASGTTINGPLTGTAITIGTPVRINGNVKATTSLFLGSGSTIDGDVDTGQMTLQASNALITGNASVDSAQLQYAGRVSKKIFCKSGTRPGFCDCVDNQSGSDVNSPNGPTCESPKPAAGTLRHFLITHDGSAGTCTTESVTVTACANATCSTPHFSGTANVTLQPGGAAVAIGTSGIATANVSSIATGVTALALTGAPAPVQCLNSATRAASCDMNFTGGVNFAIIVDNHKAGNTIAATIQALKANTTATACVPGFNNEKKNIAYSCNYVLPSTGKASMILDPTPAVAGGAASFACNTTTTTPLETSFNANGLAQLTVVYPDAGKVALNARLDNITGSKEFIVAPDHFTFSPTGTVRAGETFNLPLQAMTVNEQVTPNFQTASLGAAATSPELKLDCVGGNLAGTLSGTLGTFVDGKAVAAMSFSEAGYLDVAATLTNFLGTGLTTTGSTGGLVNNVCGSKVGPVVPWTFRVELNDPVRKAGNFYYAGEPIGLTLTALNKQGQPTTNFPKGWGTGQTIRFSALREDGTPFDAAKLPGALSGTFAADGFVSGFTPVSGAAIPKPAYAFNSATQAPLQIRLRADNGQAGALLITSATAPVGIKLPETEQARPWIRAGRVRIGNRFGRAGTVPVQMPLTVEYWSGKSWVLNVQDSFTVIPAGAFSQAPSAGVTAAVIKEPVSIKNGAGALPIASSQPGSIGVAINLGPTPTVKTLDTSCLATKTASNGADLAWLRSAFSCKDTTTKIDPSARATFGIFPVENRRIIHVREVFN